MTNKKTASARTEVTYAAASCSPYILEPLFVPGALSIAILREGSEPEPVRLTFTVFRAAGADADDWEDDPMIGRMDLCALGDDDEEVEPAPVINLGCRPDEFITVEEEGDRVFFSFSWDEGEITMPGASLDGDAFVVSRDRAMSEQGLPVQLTPDEGEPFTLHVRLPRMGFTLRSDSGEKLSGDITVTPQQLDSYTYNYIGRDSDDRFSLVLEDGKYNYLCVLQQDGETLTVRDQRNHLEVVTEIPASGRLSQLMMGASQLMVKNHNDRWRIAVGHAEAAAEVSLDDYMPLPLVRHAFDVFAAAADSDGVALIEQLLPLEQRGTFQWWWLLPDDWSYDHLDGLLDMTGLDEDPEKMMRQALLFNRFDAFMRRLVEASRQRMTAIQGDQLQARNNKRKIARQVRRTLAHRAGEQSLWTLDAEARSEMLYFATTFHREFWEALE